jgi:hypothetical protein
MTAIQLAMIPSPPWRIATAFACLALLFIPWLRRSVSRWWLIGLAFIAFGQVVIPVSDIAGHYGDGAHYDWPAWLLWLLAALAAALFISFVILAFRPKIPSR